MVLDRQPPEGDGLIRIAKLGACDNVTDQLAGLAKEEADCRARPFAWEETPARTRSLLRSPAR